MRYARLGAAFLLGYFMYALIEILARGYTHWTMALTGGAVLTMLYLLFGEAPDWLPVWAQYLLGALVVTSAELLVGMIVNVRLGWNVWDYSDLPLHFRGQISLRYSVFWAFLCIPARWVCLGIPRHWAPERQGTACTHPVFGGTAWKAGVPGIRDGSETAGRMQ